MSGILTSASAKPILICLMAWLIVISAAINPAEAMFLPAVPRDESLFDRAADLSRIQIVLESRMVRQLLEDYGLPREKALLENKEALKRRNPRTCR